MPSNVVTFEEIQAKDEVTVDGEFVDAWLTCANQEFFSLEGATEVAKAAIQLWEAQRVPIFDESGGLLQIEDRIRSDEPFEVLGLTPEDIIEGSEKLLRHETPLFEYWCKAELSVSDFIARCIQDGDARFINTDARDRVAVLLLNHHYPDIRLRQSGFVVDV